MHVGIEHRPFETVRKVLCVPIFFPRTISSQTPVTANDRLDRRRNVFYFKKSRFKIVLDSQLLSQRHMVQTECHMNWTVEFEALINR